MKKKYKISFLAFLLIFISLSSNFVVAQETGIISGTVIDSVTSEPLPGSNIVLKGTSLGTASDSKGYYEIRNIPPGNYTIICSFIGYEEKSKNITVSAGQRITLNFSLSPSAILIGKELVVIGYSTEQRRDVLGAVSSVRVDDIKKSGLGNTLNALQGHAPGVVIEPYSGQPNSNPNIKIRGIGTLNNNEPLYIIDGVPGDIRFVDPIDIKSIDILKDASAAAIYGSRAANGVVIIETKRGEREQPTSVQFSSSYGVQSLTKKWELLNAKEWLQTLSKAYDNTLKSDPKYTIPEFLRAYRANPDSFLAHNPDIDWQDVYYGKNVPVRKYNLTISGGGKNYNYSISGNYFSQDGTAADTWGKVWSIRVNSDLTHGKFKFGESILIGREENEFINGDAGGRAPGFQVLAMAPTINPWDPNNEGGYGGPKAGSGYSDATINILANNYLRDDIYSNEYFRAIGYVEYEPIPGLKFKSRANISISHPRNYYYAPTYNFGFRSINATTDLSETIGRTNYTVWENFLSYETSIDKHRFSALAGYSREKNQYRSVGASIENFPANYLPVFNLGTQNPGVNGYQTDSRLESIFGRAFYSFDDKYLMNFTIRRDGSSRFAPENRYGTFPSFSLGWRISSESFFKSIPFSSAVSDLKLRYDWGKLGNQEIGDYLYIPGVTVGSTFGTGINLNYPFGDNNVLIGSAITSFPSTGIKWEETITQDIGFDLSLYQDKITVGADYYIKKTDGILYNTPIPLSTGVPTGPLTNLASMENSGFEFYFTYKDIIGDFNYRVAGNLTTIKNKVTKLGTKNEEVWAGAMEWGQYLTTKTVVGGELGAFYLYQTAGIFKNQAEIDNYVGPNGKKIQPNAAPGDIKFVDQNGDGVLDNNDKINMGSAIPDVEFGLNFSGTYKNFDFSISMAGVLGKKMFNGTKWFLERMKAPINWSKATMNAWTPENPNSSIPRAILNDPNGNDRESDRWLEDASYLRITYIQIGYNIPLEYIAGFGANGIRIYLSIENAYTFTKYTGYDPAVTGTDLFARGVDTGIYPTVRTIRTGIEVNF